MECPDKESPHEMATRIAARFGVDWVFRCGRTGTCGGGLCFGWRALSHYLDGRSAARSVSAVAAMKGWVGGLRWVGQEPRTHRPSRIHELVFTARAAWNWMR